MILRALAMLLVFLIGSAFTTGGDATKEKSVPAALNFTMNSLEKFLISRDGQVVNRFRSKIAPDSEEVVKAIEAELAKTS